MVSEVYMVVVEVLRVVGYRPVGYWCMIMWVLERSVLMLVVHVRPLTVVETPVIRVEGRLSIIECRQTPRQALEAGSCITDSLRAVVVWTIRFGTCRA